MLRILLNRQGTLVVVLLLLWLPVLILVLVLVLVGRDKDLVWKRVRALDGNGRNVVLICTDLCDNVDNGALERVLNRAADLDAL
jgi:hypothetical protein